MSRSGIGGTPLETTALDGQANDVQKYDGNQVYFLINLLYFLINLPEYDILPTNFQQSIPHLRTS